LFPRWCAHFPSGDVASALFRSLWCWSWDPVTGVNGS
jgi:hypothetical protein